MAPDFEDTQSRKEYIVSLKGPLTGDAARIKRLVTGAIITTYSTPSEVLAATANRQNSAITLYTLLLIN